MQFLYYLVDIHQYNTEIPHNNFVSFRFITTKLCLGNIKFAIEDQHIWKMNIIRSHHRLILPLLQAIKLIISPINLASWYFLEKIIIFFLEFSCIVAASKLVHSFRQSWELHEPPPMNTILLK